MYGTGLAPTPAACPRRHAGEHVRTKPIKTSYSAAAGTAYVTFDDVHVPVENVRSIGLPAREVASELSSVHCVGQCKN